MSNPHRTVRKIGKFEFNKYSKVNKVLNEIIKEKNRTIVSPAIIVGPKAVLGV